MPPKKEQKTKEQKRLAAQAGSRKSKKKKWSKGKQKEKKDNAPIFFEEVYETAQRDIPRMKLITVATVSEKLRVTGSVARRFIRRLAKQGQIKKHYDTAGFLLYGRRPGAKVAPKGGKKGAKGSTIQVGVATTKKGKKGAKATKGKQ